MELKNDEQPVMKGEKEQATTETTTATFGETFSNAEPLDVVYMILGTLGGIVTGLSLPFFNVLFGRMLDQLNGDGSNYQEQINKVCIAFVVLAAFNLVSGFFQVYCWSVTGERQTQKFREKYVGAILSQEIGWFDTCGASELSTKVADLVGKVQDGMGRKVGDLIQYFSQVVGSFVVGLYLSWKLTVVLLCSLPLIAAAGAFMINAITSAVNQSLEQYAGAGGIATESILAIRTVTALNAQPGVITRYRMFLLDAMNVGIVKGFKVGLGNGAVFGACFLTYALGFWYGAKLLREQDCEGNGCMTGGDILAVFFSIIMGSMALGQLAPPVTAFVSAKAAIGGLLKIINRQPLIDSFSDTGAKPTVAVKGNIELNHVQFNYPSRPDVTVCKDYNLSIKGGETVALVGASGCGKSTIINLLLRFYDPQEGQILLDGVDLKSLNLQWVRDRIGYVGQEPVLFAGTIADNIAYGINPAGMTERELKDRIIFAAVQANAHDFISTFPQGYDTDVGSNGAAMSGGQKQRIAIARALIKKPAVLLLDEATSALDATSERVVQASIDKLQSSKSQTTIVIAHRLSTIRNADKICLISEGQIAECGTHDELLEKNGLYADLVRLQMTGLGDEQEEEEVVEDFVEAAALSTKELALEAAVGEAASHKAAEEVESVSEDGEVSLTEEEQKTTGKKVWGLVYRHKFYFLGALLGAAVFGSCFPVWGMILARTTEMFYLTDMEEMRRRASLMALFYICLAVVTFISSTCQFGFTAQMGERISARLRSEMFEAIMRREIAFFDDEANSIGTITTRLADDSRIANKAFGEALAKQFQAFFTLAVGVGIGFSACWQISFVVLATFPINIMASAIQMQAIAGQQYEADEPDTQVKANVPQKSPKSADGKTPQIMEGKGRGKGKVAKGELVESSVIGTSPGAMISTVFTNMRTVSAFSMQHKVLSHYTSVTQDKSTKRCEKSTMAGFGFGAAQSCLFLTYGMLFWYGGVLIASGEVEFVDMMTAILCLMLGTLGLGMALADLGDQKVGLQVAARIFKLIEDGPESPIDGLSRAGLNPTARATGRIELKNVCFHYPSRPDVEVCKNYTLTIEPGEMVALVGPSGSGKSTIINLVLRFYDPSSGQVLLDGQDVKDLNVRWLRSQIGYVGQEPVLFTGSVGNNIAKGKVATEQEELLPLEEAMRLCDQKSRERVMAYLCCAQASEAKAGAGTVATSLTSENSTVGEYSNIAYDEEKGSGEAIATVKATADVDVMNACIASNAHDFISNFPQGYDTDVGEGSIMVSGGQKQRIAIARALIKKPAVLLLDEATSALDANSERVVQASIDALQAMKEQTTVVIAHRLSTIRNADKIVVVDKGEVVEVGTHDQLLLNAGGLYSQLWAKQSGLKRNMSSKLSIGNLEAVA